MLQRPWFLLMVRKQCITLNRVLSPPSVFIYQQLHTVKTFSSNSTMPCIARWSTVDQPVGITSTCYALVQNTSCIKASMTAFKPVLPVVYINSQCFFIRLCHQFTNIFRGVMQSGYHESVYKKNACIFLRKWFLSSYQMSHIHFTSFIISYHVKLFYIKVK